MTVAYSVLEKRPRGCHKCSAVGNLTSDVI